MRIRRIINTFFEVHEGSWEIFMIILAVAFVAIGFTPDWTRLSSGQLDVLTGVDAAITSFFILEFLIRVSAAFSPLNYIKKHWLDLLALIPLIRWVRILRITRVIRVIRVLRLLRLARIIDSLDDLGVSFAKFAKMNGLQWMLLGLVALMLFLSVVFYFAETPYNPHVNTFWDSFYASVVTWAGAGYGEITPVTNVGRICGMFLIISGVTTWGILIGNLSAFLSNRFQSDDSKF